jgi:hypothetical protein
MNISLSTRSLSTKNITVMSNVDSYTVRGTRMSRLGSGQVQAPCIHIDFDVEQSGNGKAQLGMILSPEDAIALGQLLTELGTGCTSAELG